MPNLRPVVKSVSDTFNNRNSDRDLLPAGRTKSLQPIRSNSVDAKPSRSKSTSGEHMKGIREGQSSIHLVDLNMKLSLEGGSFVISLDLVVTREI